jgi:RecG-like helicase
MSVIDELPPHRSPIKTWLINEHDRDSAYNIIREELKQKRQA